MRYGRRHPSGCDSAFHQLDHLVDLPRICCQPGQEIVVILHVPQGRQSRQLGDADVHAAICEMGIHSEGARNPQRNESRGKRWSASRAVRLSGTGRRKERPGRSGWRDRFRECA